APPRTRVLPRTRRRTSRRTRTDGRADGSPGAGHLSPRARLVPALHERRLSVDDLGRRTDSGETAQTDRYREGRRDRTRSLPDAPPRSGAVLGVVPGQLHVVQLHRPRKPAAAPDRGGGETARRSRT